MKTKGKTLRRIVDEQSVEELLFQSAAQRDINIRRYLVRELGRRGDPRAVVSLVGFLTDVAPSVRAAAADALADLAGFVKGDIKQEAGAALQQLLTDVGQPTGVRDPPRS